MGDREEWVDCPVVCMVCGGEFTILIHPVWVALYRGQAFQTCSPECTTVQGVLLRVSAAKRA